MLLDTGQKLDEFKIIEYLGSGAAGDVYLALAREGDHDIISGRRYAIKIYKEWILEKPSQFERIWRELRASQEVDHPNIVKVYDSRLNPESKPYLIMEPVEGITLDKFVKRNKPLPLNVVEAIFRQLIEAIACLHNKYIFHRDIKPQNIVIDASNKITLMDLGVVKFELETTITPSEQFLGTIRYSAPEMLFGEEYDNRVDLYSAGAILYLLLTGDEPFKSKKVFSNLIVEKRRYPCLKIEKNLREESFRSEVLSELVSDLTGPIHSGFRPRLRSASTIKSVLDDPKIELSDWWISAKGVKGVNDFKSLLIQYLDPRMPQNRLDRLKILKRSKYEHLIDDLIKYLRYIETKDGHEELAEFWRDDEEGPSLEALRNMGYI